MGSVGFLLFLVCCDCYLAAQAVASGFGVASFDKDFAKFTDVTLWDEKSEE